MSVNSKGGSTRHLDLHLGDSEKGGQHCKVPGAYGLVKETPVSQQINTDYLLRAPPLQSSSRSPIPSSEKKAPTERGH